METSIGVGPITIVSVKGRVDASTFNELTETGNQLVDQGHKDLILDLHDVTYISSAGLIALQKIASKAVDNGGKAVIACLNKQVQHVIHLAGFDTVLSIFGDIATARASFRTS